MKNTIIIGLFSIMIICIGIQCTSKSKKNTVNQLTTEQKLNDFNYLYQTLKDNYPYFGVSLRQDSLDWLDNRNKYINRIRASENDSVYYFTLQAIIYELKLGHLNIIPWNMYYETYKKGAIEKPKYNKWLNTLEQSKEKAPYWEKIGLNQLPQSFTSTSATQINYRDSLIYKDKIGIIRIKSFLYDNIKKDSMLINSFLKKIKNYKYLIIDIQNNSGGSSNYWKKHIVGSLTGDTIFFSRRQIIKNGELNRYYYPEIFEKGHIITDNDSLENIPSEILDGKYYLNIYNDTIPPNQTISFKGKIFLLVNQYVFSASEDFAHFCKQYGWATVAGTRTRGDGACGEPTLIRLPESGIILNHPSLVGLNPDGSLNFESPTVPDIEIEGMTPDEKLNNLIRYIIDSK